MAPLSCNGSDGCVLDEGHDGECILVKKLAPPRVKYTSPNNRKKKKRKVALPVLTEGSSNVSSEEEAMPQMPAKLRAKRLHAIFPTVDDESAPPPDIENVGLADHSTTVPLVEGPVAEAIVASSQAVPEMKAQTASVVCRLLGKYHTTGATSGEWISPLSMSILEALNAPAARPALPAVPTSKPQSPPMHTPRMPTPATMWSTTVWGARKSSTSTWCTPVVL